MSNIGKWIQRSYGDRRYQEGKWHLVESEIEDRVVTKCGRQMKLVTASKVPSKLNVADEHRSKWGDENCWNCQPRRF